MANFTEVIAETLKTSPEGIPLVKDRYMLRGGQMNLNPADLPIFQKLFTAAPKAGGKNVGNGEVSLYWLFNWQGSGPRDPMKPTTALETRRENDPDLMIRRKPVEVKAYPSHNKLVTLGRFEKRAEFRNAIARIFAVRNLLNDEDNKRIDVLNFKYNNLEEAATDFCDFRTLLYSSRRLREYRLFQKAYESMLNFDRLVTRIGLSELCQNGVGGEKIAYELSRYIIREMLGDKPGEGGFVANMVPQGNGFNSTKGIYFHQILLDNMTKDPKTLNDSFTFSGGALKLNFVKLFS